jgi:hypothetical protein
MPNQMGMLPSSGMAKAITPRMTRKPMSIRLPESMRRECWMGAFGPLGHAAGDEEGDDDDERPPEAEQQSVRSGHIRRREVQVIGVGS